MKMFVPTVAALTLACGLAQAQTHQGPSSSATPYLTPVAGGPAVDVYSIISAGDSVNLKPDGTPYRFVGVPDGLGAYSNGDGTMTVLVNHELVNTVGIARAHGGTGSFVSQWVINTNLAPGFLSVNHGQDLNTSYVTSTPGAGTLNSFSRFCSADLAAQTAYYNPATGLGTQERIFLNGEESSGTSRAIANVVSERTGYQLTRLDGLNSAWENLLANPHASDSTLVMANSDGGDNRVYAYVGTKQGTGSVIDKAGLTNGSAWGITVRVNGTPVGAESRTSGFASSGPAVLSGQFALTAGLSGTTFLRPEDGAWNPTNPSEYFFVTTDRLDTTDGGTGGPAGQIGRSRLWKMTYNNIDNPLAGGNIEAVLDGTEGQNMFDNICVVPGTDGHTRLLMCEDVGNASHLGKVWMYDATTDVLTMVLQHDQDRFGNVGVNPHSPFNVDEESSGVIDARDTLGLGWFLIDVQAHYGLGGELSEGGQLLAVYLPSAIPAPGTAVLVGLGGLMASRRRRNG